jgi:hypothetical protein
MSLEKYERGTWTLLMADLVPPLMRRAVLENEAFAESMGLVTDGTINFNPAGAAFQRSTLLRAVREASTAAAVEIADETGLAWQVRFDRDDKVPVVIIQSGDRTIHVRHLGLLSSVAEDRITMLEAEVARVNLPADAASRWSNLVAEDGLSDATVSDFSEDINTTAVAAAGAISGTLGQESVAMDVLVPTSITYYERLIGRCDGQKDIGEYADQVLPGFLGQLLNWNPEAGLRHALLLAAHPLIIERLANFAIDKDAFTRLAKWSAGEGDVMARCAVLEMALMQSEASDDLKRELDEIAMSLIIPDGQVDEGFEMLSGVFVFVYGQLSHRKILADKPTFWRRMAAMAQAAMICRCMAPKRGALLEFAHDLRRSRARIYAIQVYADMRLGPLWQGQFALLPQLRNEIVGRVISRAANNELAATTLGLHARLLGDGASSLKSTVSAYFIYQAGPLEDNVPLARELSPEDRAVVESGLKEALPTARSFAPLVNSVFLFRQTVEIADLAAEALSRAQFRLTAESNPIFHAALTGLATCAAVTRSTALADAVLTVLRYYRRFSPDELDMDAALRIGSIACAAHAELGGWSTAMGGLMSDFAFHVLDRQEASGLENYIIDMCELTPELWASCGPALAAAESLAA